MTEQEVEILKERMGIGVGNDEDSLWWVPEEDLVGEPINSLEDLRIHV